MPVRDATPRDASAVAAFLGRRGSAAVARRGQLVDATTQPALLTEHAGRLTGVLTYVVEAGDCEILTIHAEPARAGTGSRLLEGMAERARDLGCGRLWLVTTNDNVDALRFYQRRGFGLVCVRPGAVDRARADLKPQIPVVGAYGIPLRDELELERLLV